MLVHITLRHSYRCRPHHPEAEHVVAAVGVVDRRLERAVTEALQLKLHAYGGVLLQIGRLERVLT
jgi:hypothetical protein